MANVTRGRWLFGALALAISPVAVAGASASCAGARSHPSDEDARSTTGTPVASRASASADTSTKVADGGGGAGASRVAEGPKQIDPDGNDDDEDPGQGRAPDAARWERVGTPPLALTRICDLTPLRGALYAAHAHQPLGTDGATITRYRPDDGSDGAHAKTGASPFGVAFDWNRPGEPVKGGGAGQGFIRVRAIGGRLFVPDADPPYGGLGLVDGAEGYVFVSNDEGKFAPPRAPHFRPPFAPELRVDSDAGARAGAGILPRAYHVLDVIRFRGAIYASTGSVPPKEQAWRGPSPGALHRASEDGSRWVYETDYPFPWKDGVWRLTYMVRFKDRLYAGIQDYDRRDPNDYVYFAPEARDGGATVLRHEDAHPTRITRSGASGTLRWWVDTRATPARLYWLAWTREGIRIHVTTDGDRWAVVPLPDDAGRPTDITRFRDAVVVLTETGLYRIEGSAVDGPVDAAATASGVADANARPIALLDDGTADGGVPSKKRPKSPFEVSDFFCTAPMAVMNNVLYAGGQRGGSLYRLVE